MAVNTTYDIVVRYSGDPTYQPVFNTASQIWQEIITADLPDVNSATYGFIDDLLIDASVVAIDGAGGILGQAGPNDFRSGTSLPDHGTMQFDSADVASMYGNGTLLDVILHEMGHVLGIGTLWTTKGLKASGSFSYTGANGIAEYKVLSGNPGATSVPLETTGGSGTAGAHWSEAVFGNELMTGFLGNGFNPLSRLTIASLKDLGYSVDVGAADPYSLSGHVVVDDLSGNSRTTGRLTVNAAPTAATLEVAGDRDWWSVQLSAGASYTIRVSGAPNGSGTLGDPLLRLYDSTGRLVVQDDDFGGSLNSLISFTPSVSGLYYVGAGAHADGFTGTYTVSVAAGSGPQPDLTASNASVSDTTPDPGQGETITFRVDNSGTAAAGGFFVGVYLSTDAAISTTDTFLGQQFFASLSAGSSVSGSVTVNLPSSAVPGSPYFIGVIADYTSQISESLESNNTSNAVQITLTDQPPNITSNGGGSVAAVSMRESLPAATTVTATDPDAGTKLIYSIAGGADAGAFQIDAATGVLYFAVPADYEHPADSDHNNSYIVQVSASDGSLSDTQTLTITVTDGNDAVLGMAAPADFSHDGKDDILWRNASGAVALWTMNGGQKAADQSVSSIGNDWNFVSSADFGGDGKPDLLFRHDSGPVALWTMNGAQKVADQVVSAMGNDWHLEQAADFNGDGKADILWRHDTGFIALWTMNGAQKVADQVVSLMGNDWHLAATADLNADGKADILWRHDTGAVAVWTMNGAQKAADQVVSAMDNSWKIADTADFNGDGKTDILWRNDSGAVDIWTMSGGQKVADQLVSQIGNDWHFADTADFNGDGKADILWRHDNGTLAIWTMNGGQKAADQVVQFMGNDWHVLGLGDFSGDNKDDILWRHDSGAVAVWTMNGAQKVADQVVAQLGHDWMLA
jgi:hypothetical protein